MSKWLVQMRYNGKKRFLGYFENEDEAGAVAAQARDDAFSVMKGKQVVWKHRHPAERRSRHKGVYWKSVGGLLRSIAPEEASKFPFNP